MAAKTASPMPKAMTSPTPTMPVTRAFERRLRVRLRTPRTTGPNRGGAGTGPGADLPANRLVDVRFRSGTRAGGQLHGDVAGKSRIQQGQRLRRNRAAISPTGHHARIRCVKNGQRLGDRVAEDGPIDRTTSRLMAKAVVGSQTWWNRRPPHFVTQPSAQLKDRVDETLQASPGVVATADSAILDRCDSWLNLARFAIEGRRTELDSLWLLDLS